MWLKIIAAFLFLVGDMFCETKLHELEKKKKRDHFGIKREKKKEKENALPR